MGASQKHWEMEAKIGAANLSEHLIAEFPSVADKQEFFPTKARVLELASHYTRADMDGTGTQPTGAPRAEFHTMDPLCCAGHGFFSQPDLPIFSCTCPCLTADIQTCGILALMLLSPVFLPTAGAAQIQKKGVGGEGGTVLEAACTFYR